MTIVLAIETSQRTGSVALGDGSGAVHALTLPEGRRSGDALHATIDRLVRDAGLAPRDLDVVGVSIGPGGFTGLRIAVSTAKMLALALDVRVVPVPSALVAVEGTSHDALGDGPVLVALASKRGTIWATRVRRAAEGWTATETGSLEEADAVALDGCTAVLGDEHVPEALRSRCATLPVALVAPVFTATACLALTHRRLAEPALDPHELLPLYPRPPEATRLWTRQG